VEDLESSPEAVKKFAVAELASPAKSLASDTPRFQHPSRGSSPLATPQRKLKFRTQSFSDLDSDDEKPVSSLKFEKQSRIEEQATQRPVFTLPSMDGFADESFDSINVPNEAFPLEHLHTETQSPPPYPSSDPNPDEAVCPMCKEAVPRSLLESWDNGRMTIKTQVRFCKAHKRLSAEELYATRGYPTIDWSALDSRLNSHHEFLLAIIEGGKSHFRDVMHEEVKAGGGRTLRRDIFTRDVGAGWTPGYYGSRGLRAMAEHMMHVFSPELRRRAVDDPLVSARGVMTFVQMVLVPEVAVRLIADDQALGDDWQRAREIMGESRALGELLHEELRDVVPRKSVPDGDEDGWCGL
jgi:hypothetical protein